jgi:predicted nuclease with TOPRIM domain
LWQAVAFANHVASGALTSEFAAERQRLEGRIERLQVQHTDAVRDKSAAENKSRRLTERLAAAEAEKEDLRRQLAEERKDANRACAEAQAAQVEAKLVRAEASLARQRAEEMETRLYGLRDRLDKTEASTRAEVERTHTQLMDAYRELGAWTAPFEAPGQEVGLRFLGWLQEELEVLPTIVTSLMSFTSLITYEGAVNALSREGCGHFEVFDQSDEGFERGIFQVEDSVLKRSAGALFDRMWGPHDRETVRERSDRAMDQVKVHMCDYMCGYVCVFVWLLNGCVIAVDGA